MGNNIFVIFPSDQNGPSSKGTDFYVVFLVNSNAEIDSNNLLQLLVSTDEPNPVVFTVTLHERLPEDLREGFPLTASVSYGEVVTVTIPGKLAVQYSRERYNSIHIQSEGGKRISVQGFNDATSSSDGFLAFPCDAMRTEVFTRFEYFVMAADQSFSPDRVHRFSTMAIVPCDNDTIFSVEPSTLISFDLGFTDVFVSPFSLVVGPGSLNSRITFAANAGQTIVISIPTDLTGTIIQGNKPLAVFSGHQCSEVPVGVDFCDHVVEQMPPGMTYGSTFFLVPLAGRLSGDVFRVGTLTDNTQITVTCVKSPTDMPSRIPLEDGGAMNRSDYITFMTPGNFDNQIDYRPSYCSLESTQPVIVAQYSTGTSLDKFLEGKDNVSSMDVGDPFMILMPAVDQFLNNYTLAPLGKEGEFPFRYINLAISAPLFNNSIIDRNSVRIDGSIVTPIDEWIPFYCLNNTICGYGAQVALKESGVLHVYHQQPNVGLGVVYYAFQNQESYGMSQGYELAPISGDVQNCLFNTLFLIIFYFYTFSN